ncbi:MAG: DUF2071 domain-containing protein [Salinibacter sp.]
MVESSPPRILQATARNRVVVAYTVPPDQVASLLPEGLVPVERDGMAYVSLVGVELTKVQVLGLVPPGFRRVPTVELRVHAKPTGSSTDAEGTWTVQAHMPRRLVAWGARTLYGEPAAVTSMQPTRREQADYVEVTYRYDWRGREQRIRVRGERPPDTPSPDTIAPVLLRPAWRFGTARAGTLLRTRIERPEASLDSGRAYPVQEHHVTVQWTNVYGEIGKLLTSRSPALVLLAPDTPVTVRWRTYL